MASLRSTRRYFCFGRQRALVFLLPLKGRGIRGDYRL